MMEEKQPLDDCGPAFLLGGVVGSILTIALLVLCGAMR